MTTYALAPSPKWYFLDAQGRPAAGGFLYTYDHLDQTTPKFVFSDPGGNFPYTDPIQLDGTGGTPVPIYWDTTTAGLYYIVVTDAAGNIIFTLNNFPLAGSGGVTPITTISDIQNHIINGQFIFIDAPTTAASLITPTPKNDVGVRVAPASGFFKNASGGYDPVYAGNISGWRFGESGGLGETSSIQFIDVTPIGHGNPSAPSANATRFFRYTLSVAGAPQTGVALFQVTPQVETYSGETLTVSFDCRSSTAGIGVFEILQFYGSGGAPSASTNVTHNFNYTVGIWSRVSFQINVPSVVDKNKGTNNDDGLNITWNFPLNVLGSFDLTNLQIQRGTYGTPAYVYQTYNQDQYKVLIDLLASIGPHTGDLKYSTYGSFAFSPEILSGWFLLFNSAQAIGKSAGSGATSFGEKYRALYILWWTNYSPAECIVNGGRGGSAAADFDADKRMTIPQHLINYVLGIAGNSAPFGSFEGEREHLLTIPEIPSHTHNYNFSNPGFGTASGTDSPNISSVTSEVTSPTGGGLPHNNMPPTNYVFLYVKL